MGVDLDRVRKLYNAELAENQRLRGQNALALLEACRRALLHLPTCTRPDCDCVYCTVRDAIANAEGK